MSPVVGIAGAGPGGAYLARALAAAGIEAHLFDPSPVTRSAGIVLAEEDLSTLTDEVPALSGVDVQVWDTVHVVVEGDRVSSGGHRITGVRRSDFVAALRSGVHRHPAPFPGPEGFDVVVAADGTHSALRRATFEAEETTGGTHFVWARTPARLPASFLLRDTGAGPLVVHAYPHACDESTFIAEGRPEAFASIGAGGDRAGFERALAAVFHDDLAGQPVVAQTFPPRGHLSVRARQLVSGKTVLLGDAAHAMHFSIGSGSMLAIDDARVLARALADSPDSPDEALQRYEAERAPVVATAHADAAASQAWFEALAHRRPATVLQTAFALRTRRDFNSFGTLRERDPEFAARVLGEWAPGADDPLTVPLRLGGCTLPSRVPVLYQDDDRCRLGNGVGGVDPVLSPQPEPGAGLLVTDASAPLPDAPFYGVVADRVPGRTARSAFADRVRSATGRPVVLLTDEPVTPDDARTLVLAGRCDAVAHREGGHRC